MARARPGSPHRPTGCARVLSPRTAAFDRGLKSDHYAEHGVRHLWIVDPEARTLEAYVLQGGGSWVRLLVATGADARRIPPFEAVEIELSRLWLPGERAEET